jgi:hypothetical protein
MLELKALKLTDEDLFIVLSCRKALNFGPADTFDVLLKHNLDWTYIEGMIRLHGIAGIVNSTLAQVKASHNIPDEFIKHLTLAGRQTAFKNLVYRREFASIVKACNSEHIRIVPLKGIAFLTSLYEHNAALRTLSDIDILVENKDLKRVENILLAIGYQPEQTGTHDSNKAFHSIYRRCVSGFTILIEVHWDFDYADSPYAIDIAEMWQRSHAISRDIGTYYTFSTEDTLILNCFHILRRIPKGPDVFLHLKHFCDIALLLKKHTGSIEWESIIQRSRQYRVVRPIGMVLFLVRALLSNEEVPSAVFNALQAEGFQDDFAICMVREYIFNTDRARKKSLPFWMVDLATPLDLWEKVKIFLELPQIFFKLFRARYYGRMGRSVTRTTAYIMSYYIRKGITAFVFLLRYPGKAAQLKKELKETNRKTKAAIDWMEGSPPTE